MKKSNTIYAADLFCGAGGSSSGLYKAADKLGVKVNLLAVNHWNIAIATHSANHKEAAHLCETLDGVNPRKVVPGGHLDLLVASPECTHHSRARGGKPMNDQSRASAWHVLRWAEALDISNILIENVKEFASWGPLGSNGKPLKSREGETFQAFVSALRSLGYAVEHKILNAADYGDPTTRERLFVIARKGRRKIVWPIPTHSKNGDPSLFGQTKKWRAAREIIDWNVPGKSIFGRKKPLAPNTLRRIWAGIQKFCPGIANDPALAQPFLVMMNETNDARSVDLPCPAVTATGNHIGVAEPFVIHTTHHGRRRTHSTGEPLPTVTGAKRGEMAVIEPFIFANRTNNSPKSTKEPVPTLCTGNHIALIEPFLVSSAHGDNKPGSGRGNSKRVRSIHQPAPTVTGTGSDYALIEPFLCSAGGPEVGARPVSEPMNTVLTRDHMALVEPFIVNMKGKSKSRGIDKPVPTITAGASHVYLAEPFVIGQQSGSAARSTKNPLMTVAGKGAIGLAEPYLVRYNGTGGAEPTTNPMPTLTAKDRFGLAEPLVKSKRGRKAVTYYLDIRFRMLQPHELAAAMSFGPDYKFTGNREAQVKQIGNAVPVNLAMALCSALLSDERRLARPARKLKKAA